MTKQELRQLVEEWEKYFLDEETQENIDKSNELFNTISENLPYLNKSQEERYLDYSQWFKDYDDFKAFTLAIIDGKDYFYSSERYECSCDEEGYSINGYYQYHHCWWCGEIVDDAEYINEDYICSQCKAYLNSREGEC